MFRLWYAGKSPRYRPTMADLYMFDKMTDYGR
jgi:hypothetical protein